jgi:hypothetical protein
VIKQRPNVIFFVAPIRLYLLKTSWNGLDHVIQLRSISLSLERCYSKYKGVVSDFCVIYYCISLWTIERVI